MPDTTVRALRIDKPGTSLAVWLAVHHPDLFLATFKQAQAARAAKRVQMGALADDAPGLTTTFDVPLTDVSFSEPVLTTITFDPSTQTLPDYFLSDATDSSSGGFLSSIGEGLTSAGTTVGGALSSFGSGVLSALGSVGSYLTSSSGLTNMTSLAKSIFTAQAANSTAQTQAAVLNTQIARANAGQLAAPITYTQGSNGQLVPVYAAQTAQGAVYHPLTNAGVASLAPSALTQLVSQYGLWIAAGGAVLFMLSRRG